VVESAPVPLVVLSAQQDPVELINSTLRNAGHPAHCTWVQNTAALEDALIRTNPQLLFLYPSSAEELKLALNARERAKSPVPVLVVRDTLQEEDLNQLAALDVQDVVTLQGRARLQKVAQRELAVARLDQTLAGTLASATQYREQMRAFMAGSADALAHVQEGIVLDVNPAWAEIFGRASIDDFAGQTLLDFFEESSHAGLKGALSAALKGRWNEHALKTVGLTADGREVPLEIQIERFEFEGEPALRLCVPTQKRDVDTLTLQLEDALRYDPLTGLLRRVAFFEQVTAQAATPLKAGLRAVVYIEPDRLNLLETDIGPLGVELLLESVAKQLHKSLQPEDLACRVAPYGLAVMIERGNLRELEAWINRLLQHLSETVLPAGERSVSITCSAGATLLSARGDAFGPALASSIRLTKAASAAGGNRLQRPEEARSLLSPEGADESWAEQIKAALAEDRFRLLQLPVASLTGEGEAMYDLVLRMLDKDGNDILPLEFIPSAQRTDLMRHIDRWVVSASMSLCAARKPHRVFVRLSLDSLKDPDFGVWLDRQLRYSGADPSRIVFELPAEMVALHLNETKDFLKLLRSLRLGFAIEHFGADHSLQQLLTHTSPQFVKIDGALVQGITNNKLAQEQVRAITQASKERNIPTVAERVEDANTMAVLWQLGVVFVQGHFVSAPESVVLGA
jgi:multidomain signaling protein FimX